MVQCGTCLDLGRVSTYRGESSRSAHQHHGEHARDLTLGVADSPLVLHVVEEHGGIRPQYIFTVSNLEAMPLYRAVRESVETSSQPQGPGNMNRCQEWGTPLVPIVSVTGGDNPGVKTGQDNNHPEWSRRVLGEIREGGLKRVRLTDLKEKDDPGPCVPEVIESNAKLAQMRDPPVPAETQPAPKRARRRDAPPTPLDV